MSQTNDIAEKFDEITQEIALDSQNADLYFQRSMLYLRAKKFPQAIDDCSHLIALNPKDESAYLHRILCYQITKNYPEAINDCTKVLELHPQDKLYYHMRGVSYENMGRLDKAIGDYTKCIELEPNDVEGYEYRKECYTKMKKYEEALNDLEKIYELDCDIDYYHEEKEAIINSIHEENVKRAKKEERKRIIRNQAHDIKNILSSIISPLMYLQRRIHKPQIEQALKQVDVLSKMVNATSLSYSGSPEDFFYDAKNNEKGISLKDMILISVESSLANIVEDIDYYAIFREQYFPDDAIREKALAEYRDLQAIPTDERFTALQKFSQKYMCRLEIDFGNSDTFVLGDEKSSGVKMLALFNELIFNAIKYSAFVNENKRFVSICCVNDDKNVYLKVKNSYAGDSETKTTGTGNLIVDNLIDVMQGKVTRDGSKDNCFITEIRFSNFWKGGKSGEAFIRGG